MSTCTNAKFEQMLYAYELGMLSGEDEQELELHLYECSHCFESAKQFKDATWLLRHSSSAHARIRSDAAPYSRFSITRIMLIAALLIAVAIPVYHVVFDSEQSDVVQELYLLPTRSSEPSVIDLEKGGLAEIRFVVEGTKPGNQFNVSIVSQDGHTVYSSDSFSDFNSNGLGTIAIPMSSFEKGFYQLAAVAQAGADSTVPTYYRFQVK